MAVLAPVASAIDELIFVVEQQPAHDGEAVRAVGFATDTAGEYWVISGGEDATLRSWSLQLAEERVQDLDHEIYDLEASTDGSIVATGEGGWNGGTSTDTLRIWSADGLAHEIGTGAPIGFVYVVALSPDNKFAAVSGFYGEILIYETTSLTLYATKETGKKRTKAIAFSPDGSMLAAIWKGGTIQLWSFPDHCEEQSCELALLPVSMKHGGTWDLSIAFWPHNDSDGTTKIVSGSDSGMVKVWTIKDPHGTPIVTVESVPSGGVRSLAWSPNGSMIVAGGNGEITVYDADTLEILSQKVNAHSSRVNDVAFSPDGLKIVSGGDDGALKLWQVPESSAGCSIQTDCDDFNECTIDDCVGNVCQNTPADDGSSCNGEVGICCSGSCDTAACMSDMDCDDGDNFCSLNDVCRNPGTCAAACDNSFPACSLHELNQCCGPQCNQSNDLDCACVPTHSKEKGVRCRDNIDNDCDGLVDGDDPDC